MNAWIMLLYMGAGGSVFLTALAWLAGERVWAGVHLVSAVACVIFAEVIVS